MARTIRKKMFIGALLALGITLSGAVPRASSQQPTERTFEDKTALPAGPAGARIRSLIEVVNSGDEGRVRRFLDEECDKTFRERIPMDDHVATVLGFRRDTGGLDFYSVRAYTPERPGLTVVIVKDRLLGNWWGLTFRFGAGPDHLVTGLGINTARPPNGLVVGPPLTESEAVAEIRTLLSKLKDKDWLSGAVLVANGGSVLLTDFDGEASKAFHVPNTIDTKFNLGSMNKMFTAVAVARLVEAGKLSFDDPIGRWVDESWLPKDVTAKITVRHLITHTSGLGSYFNDVYQKSSRSLFRRLDDYKPLIRDDRPAFTPGDRFQYSNTGLFLLGVVIEKVTGEDYFDHIRKAIYAPAGMTDSDCYEMDYPVENLAIGYSPDWKSPYGWRNNLYAHVLKGGPAGGGFSTVKDLHRFALALLADKLISRPTRDLMWTDSKGSNYGYGFVVTQSPGGKAVGHSGGFDGINSQLDIYVDTGYIVVAMANIDMGASPLANRIGGILARVKTP